MYQRWRRLTFLHWRYDPDRVEPFIPAPLTLDTFDGAAWVGLVPFEIIDLRFRGSPKLPWISRFPETNVRTYVRDGDGQRGVWFFTLEAERLIAVLAARAFYHLPYRWAEMKVAETAELVHYTSVRKRLFGEGRTEIVIEPGEAVTSGAIENFLTARFRLYSMRGARLFTAPIEHDRWQLQRAQVRRLEENLVSNCGLPPPEGEPLVHYSADLQVKIGNIRRIR
jgi:uncharacterized protein YqjF (DUF2071 family)